MSVLERVRTFAAPPIIGLNLLLPDGKTTLRVSEAAHHISDLLQKQKEALAAKDKALSIELSKQILELRSLETISPAFGNARLFSQLRENEKVHPIANASQLRQLRLGRKGRDSKTCEALIARGKYGRVLLASIFEIHVTVPANGGLIKPWNLPGNVDAFKAEKQSLLSGEENLTGYYSINSAIPSGGKVLVGDLDQEGKAEITISPIRGFTQRYN